MLIKWALVCAILMEEDRIQDIYIYIYIYKRKTKENTYANKICKTKEREKKSVTDYNKQKGLRAYKSKLKQNKTP